MHLEADQVSIDDARQISTFEGKVQLTQGTMTIRGDKIVVVEDKKGFAHGTATGHPASFRQKREGSDEYAEGYGERIEYDSQGEIVDLFGLARMTRGQDEVRGDHITYNSKTETFRVLSKPGEHTDTAGRDRVRVIIQPKGSMNSPEIESLPIKPVDKLAQPEGDR
jgi:lipopolysaccharide export system protein LptA